MIVVYSGGRLLVEEVGDVPVFRSDLVVVDLLRLSPVNWDRIICAVVSHSFSLIISYKFFKGVRVSDSRSHFLF